jgi:hypothetical protein
MIKLVKNNISISQIARDVIKEQKDVILYHGNAGDFENIIIESQAVSFNKSVKPKRYKRGDDYIDAKIYTYTFVVDGVNMECVVYPNEWTVGKYICVFIANGGTTKDRVGKGLIFLNTVLETVANCLIDAINDNPKITTIQFDGTSDVRDKAYIRFFTRHPVFKKFDIDTSRNYSGYIELKVPR